MPVRAVRGAITVKKNEADEIISNTKILLSKIIELNRIKKDDMISIFFTATPDIDAVFPSVAAREMGFTDVPLMCASELAIKGSLEKCIRIMMHINSEKNLNEIIHVYLNDAKKLRPDLTTDKEDIRFE